MVAYIPGYEGIYTIDSETAEIVKVTNGRVLRPTNMKGYFRVNLIKNKKPKSYYVHRLLALTFIPNPEGKPEVDHIDRNPHNNALTNLRWADDYDQNHNKWLPDGYNLFLPGTRAKTLKRMVQSLSRQVEMRDKDDHSILLGVFPSVNQAAIRVFGDKKKNGTIHNCCNGKRLSAYGYYWCFTDPFHGQKYTKAPGYAANS